MAYTIILDVLKAFRSVTDNDAVLSEGSTLETTDIKRVNSLVGRGLAQIASIEEEGDGGKADVVPFRGGEHDLQSVKDALTSLGIAFSPNAGVKGIAKKVEELTDEQADALEEKLSVTE